ncbi:M64 family metallo-endopeptidase [Nonomuraea sp. MCN248]|uniref:M64 family metallo-endopeptidase n=1 Tax=Nonomuraea corallina TaxID=2989783 RepID=A0ABT4S5U6_9ACTN|nr:M64 family metallopeptidase [Nonomuraea corallina]MDA0632552.1 M64 family metallo-endopeptidase [Nonomuraea corallina]
MANSGTYGGAGGAYATASGSNAISALISPHELGHSRGGLQDEYDHYQRGVPGGARELTASLGGDTRAWTIDATPPTTGYELSEPLARELGRELGDGPRGERYEAVQHLGE